MNDTVPSDDLEREAERLWVEGMNLAEAKRQAQSNLSARSADQEARADSSDLI